MHLCVGDFDFIYFLVDIRGENGYTSKYCI